jgi:predicted Rossmann fold flavoprotein
MQNVNKKYDLIVIGGGASGMMTAVTAAKNGASVAILEKNRELGKKLKITGGGRCNITNANYDNRSFLENFGDSGKFLFSPFSKFSVKNTFTFFEKRGLPLVIESRKRVFPKTQRAYDVFKVFENDLKKYKVDVIFGTQVVKLNREGENISSVRTKNGKIYSADFFAMATGGVSAPKTGSTGEGFVYLSKIGHTIKKPNPNVVPLTSDNSFLHKISGTS